MKFSKNKKLLGWKVTGVGGNTGSNCVSKISREGLLTLCPLQMFAMTECCLPLSPKHSQRKNFQILGSVGKFLGEQELLFWPQGWGAGGWVGCREIILHANWRASKSPAMCSRHIC